MQCITNSTEELTAKQHNFELVPDGLTPVRIDYKSWKNGIA